MRQFNHPIKEIKFNKNLENLVLDIVTCLKKGLKIRNNNKVPKNMSKLLLLMNLFIKCRS